MIEPEIVDSNPLPLDELPETVVLTAVSSAYHAPSDGGPACNVGDEGNYNEHDRVALRGHYPPCRSCFNRAAVADEMLYDDD